MVNEWWLEDRAERFWMETIRRPEHGDAIRAPLTKSNGGAWPYYELVGYVRDGDVVLHWDTNRQGLPSAFVGMSVVDGAPYATDDVTYNDGAPTDGTEALLRNYVRLDVPLTLPELNARFDKLAGVRDATEVRSGTPAYFPFNIRNDGTVRAMQGGYLTKFPRALFTALPELADAVELVDSGGPETGDGVTASGGGPRIERRQAREAGYIADAVVRKAIEDRAVQLATDHYSSLGYDVQDVGASRSYDLHLTYPGSGEERHVEVKGSTGDAAEVELTIGEVNHASDFQPTDLFVVGGIAWRREADAVIASGGDARWFADWTPDASDLAAIRFRYTVPAGVATHPGSE